MPACAETSMNVTSQQQATQMQGPAHPTLFHMAHVHGTNTSCKAVNARQTVTCLSCSDASVGDSLVDLVWSSRAYRNLSEIGECP